ncbi:DUF4230 domain-containing protein [Stakelama pacifica]|uniref:Uncharacterized protein DUF4230 n=1 Tax=Stakelama pacifica TaxID=517720 RepID=A0A4R6FHG3_9SPHN|nr:uncharacterized protein DUF4230 [Stakelama pacifica]GGO97577.1 hypothetical protein GCM10011329_26780 [Stakelama pacifica]
MGTDSVNEAKAERRGGAMLRGCLIVLGVLALMAMAAGGAFWAFTQYLDRKIDPDPVTIASGSLAGMREEAKLSTFAARYVAVVTSTQSRLGLSAKKTLIMPGMVRYQIDLAKITDRDVAWDAQTKTLEVHLPPIELVGPQVDLNAMKEYDDGGLLLRFTDAGERLDAANRKAGQQELLNQARQAVPMRLARDSARRAVERSFAMPLRAAGIDATVHATFADERTDKDRERWDVSRPIADVLADRKDATEQ